MLYSSFIYSFNLTLPHITQLSLLRSSVFLRNKTCSPFLNSLVKTEANVWENSRADQGKVSVFTWRHGGHVGVLWWLFFLFETPTWLLCLLCFVFLRTVWKPRILTNFAEFLTRLWRHREYMCYFSWKKILPHKRFKKEYKLFLLDNK